MHADANLKNCSGEELGNYRKGSMTFNRKIRNIYNKQRWQIHRIEPLESINLYNKYKAFVKKVSFKIYFRPLRHSMRI